jgi:hypothetical protein
MIPRSFIQCLSALAFLGSSLLSLHLAPIQAGTAVVPGKLAPSFRQLAELPKPDTEQVARMAGPVSVVNHFIDIDNLAVSATGKYLALPSQTPQTPQGPPELKVTIYDLSTRKPAGTLSLPLRDAS